MDERPSVRVLVLGDVTRSPRIKNHAKSFAKEGWRVKFSGYRGGKEDSSEKLTYSYIKEPPACFDRYLPRVLALILKV